MDSVCSDADVNDQDAWRRFARRDPENELICQWCQAMSAVRQSVALIEDWRPSLPSSEVFDGAEDTRVLSVLMAAIADLVQIARTHAPRDANALSDILDSVISRYFGRFLDEVASRSEFFGQYEQFEARDLRACEEEKNCSVWLALIVLDGEAARIAIATGVLWTPGILADRYCPNPPTVQQVLACRQLPLTHDLSKLYGLAQQVYGGLERHTKSTSSGRDIVPVTGAAKLSACFPSYIRNFNGVVSLPASAVDKNELLQFVQSPEIRVVKSNFLRQSVLVGAMVLLCLFAGFLLGWVYQGQIYTGASVADSSQEPL